jgi:hypothetical protein
MSAVMEAKHQLLGDELNVIIEELNKTSAA